MARKNKEMKTEDPTVRGTSKRGLESISKIMNQLSTSIYGTTVSDDTIDNLNNRFNDIMKNQLNILTGDGANDMNSFIGKLYSQDRDNAYALDMLSQTYNIGTRDSAVTPSDFITDQYRNRLIKQADAFQVSNQLIELSEAKSTMRDAIVSPDLNSGRINRNINLDSSTTTSANKDYIPVIEAVEKKLDTHKQIKDFIVDNTLVYGMYYAYTIPYKDIFNNFARKYKSGRKANGRYFESVDDSVEDLQVDGLAFMEDAEEGKTHIDTDFIESVSKDMMIDLEIGQKNEDTVNTINNLRNDVETLLSDYITISTKPIPIPILEDGIEAYKDIDNTFIRDGKFMEDVDFFEAFGKDGEVMKTDEDTFLRKYGNNSDDGFYHENKKDTKNDFNDIKDCYNKFVPPTRMLPVQIMGTTIFYLYIQTDSANPLSTILSYSSQLKTKDPSNKVNRLTEDIAEKIVEKFDVSFVRDNRAFKEIIVSALQYYELGNQKIHFQIVPKQYVTEFKINVDEDGIGHSMLEKSLFYAKLYLMIFMFKIISILTKSNDTTINYIRTSGIDKNAFNKAQEIARQKQSRRITLNDMFSYTNVINKVASGSEIFMPLTKSGDKPIETDVISGQEVQLDTPFMESLRNNYILATGVPSAIMNYLNEADFAKSIENANTKMNGRVVNYQLDLNPGITEWYRKLLRYSSNIPEEVLASLEVSLPAPKGNSNITTQELINNYQTLQDFLVKLYAGEDADNVKVQKFSKKLAEMHLPMINFSEIDKAWDDITLAATGDDIVPGNDDLSEF